jgi:hypothetical protein
LLLLLLLLITPSSDQQWLSLFQSTNKYKIIHLTTPSYD